jgi:hypothetical protein
MYCAWLQSDCTVCFTSGGKNRECMLDPSAVNAAAPATLAKNTIVAWLELMIAGGLLERVCVD